jgi:hypothetical protein
MKKKVLYPLAGFAIVFLLQITYSTWRFYSISSKWLQIENESRLSFYFASQDYFLGLSYALAAAFTIYAVLKFTESRKAGIAGVTGGVTLAGIIYFGACFLLGCCGSPMLAVYLGLFGSKFLGFTKPLTLIITLIFILIGFFWLEKSTKKSCCEDDICSNDKKI